MAARTVNKVILLGRLGKDAETKFSPSGSSRTLFSLATNRNVKDGQTGEWKEETDWHNIVVWKAENVANYLLKGKQVYIEGRLSSRSYDDKDGVKKYITEVVADNVILLGGDGPGGGGGRGQADSTGDEFGAGPVSMPRGARRDQPSPAPAGGTFEPGITDDDVPF